jgi:DSF synthase
MSMLKEIYELQLSIIEYFKNNDMKPQIPIRYYILASQTSEIYNYGGDLNLFYKLILEQDRDTLNEYGKIATEIIYLNSVNFNLPITTIALVEGTALGGGFEAALSCNILIAEENTKMGLPEIRFNLFPGMGAYTLLARVLGINQAEDIISSGKVYDTKFLYDLDIVNILAKSGTGKQTLDKFMKKHTKAFNGMQAILKARHRYKPISRDELMDINEIWVDAALKLEDKDLKVMQKLIKAQNSKSNNMKIKSRTKQDRRVNNKNITFPFYDSIGNKIFTDRRSGLDRRLCS